MIDYILEIQLKKEITRLTDLFVKKPEIELHIEDIDYELIAWGDPICDKNFRERFSKDKSPEFIVNNIYGHYYFILLNKRRGEIFIGNSMFSILPVYYNINKDRLTISGNAQAIGKYLGADKICKRFVLETILFNYPLFNNSILQEIDLLPANSYFLIVKGKPSVEKHTIIASLFERSPVRLSGSVKSSVEEFLAAVAKYLPDIPYATSLTGGFDGRTLVSAGLYYNRNFSTFSFGTDSSRDIEIAKVLSAKAKLSFFAIELGDDYAKNMSLDCGQEFIRNSSGTATFARAHYLYAVKRLAENQKIIITGNFGSEIFRAAHILGVVISPNLYALFNSPDAGEGIKAIEISREFDFLNRDSFKSCWESLKADIGKLPCYNNDYSGLTKNQRFYVFIFEELFRKYFGSEMANQFKYLKNRTPFLDIEFLKAIFKTGFAGIHSDFFEHNPLKRYKGQVLYAHIIKVAYPDFGKMMTDKGYRPDDLINIFGKVNIAKGYMKKIIRKISPGSDPYGVAGAWETNRDSWLQIPVSGDLFNVDKKIVDFNKDILFKIISLSYIKNIINKS